MSCGSSKHKKQSVSKKEAAKLSNNKTKKGMVSDVKTVVKPAKKTKASKKRSKK